MARTKEFSREEALEKALPVFWSKGYSATSLKDLETATGVNKSGLYSEFHDKEDLFLESLKHYFANRPNRALLLREPFGWKNLEDYMKAAAPSAKGTRGCFAVNTLRELGGLSDEAVELIEAHRARLRKLYAQNIAAEKTRLSPEAIADLYLTFYYGLQAEQNLEQSRTSFNRRVDDFIAALKTL